MILWDWNVCQRNLYMALCFKANYPRLMKLLSSFKRPQTCTVNHPNILKTSQLGYFLYIHPGWWGNWLHSSTQMQKNLLSFPRWGKEKEREKQKKKKKRERSSRKITSCWCFSTFLLCVRYSSSTLNVFSPTKDIEVVKGFCFIKH